MITKYPGLNLELTAHTVSDGGKVHAGFLVRDSRTHARLGFVWPVGELWRWRTDDGEGKGDRSTSHMAVKVLREYADLGRRAPVKVVDSGDQVPLPRPTRMTEVETLMAAERRRPVHGNIPVDDQPDYRQAVPVRLNTADMLTRIKRALDKEVA